jgi:hypothetical protein
MKFSNKKCVDLPGINPENEKNKPGSGNEGNFLKNKNP